MKKEKTNRAYLGIELGSTRIKTVAVDSDTLAPISGGSYSWRSELVSGLWTYDLDEAWHGIREALSKTEHLDRVEVMGISAMMHGYLAFDENWQLLVPFRTWQNTVTERAARELTELFGFNIPQRWSVAHLYHAILNNEEHISRIAHITTLAGYVHYMLTGVNAVGICEGSGIFPLDPKTLRYDEAMLRKFNKKLAELGFSRPAEELFPEIISPDMTAGAVTERGSELLSGLLAPGVLVAPPEGDATTGMIATNSLAPRTGNISAGTSVFAMAVLERPLSRVYEEVDMLITPDGNYVAMIHCNNCTNGINALASLIRETLGIFGKEVTDGELYTGLFEASLLGEGDCGGVLSCNYLSGEILTGFEKGVPMLVRRPDAAFTIGNLMRAEIYGALATLKLGLNIFIKEGVNVTCFTAHGGLFKTPGVAQRYMAAACNTDVLCLETSGEGGPYGMALLSAYTREHEGYNGVAEFLDKRVFANAKGMKLSPLPSDVEDFERYMKDYEKLLKIERAATEVL